MRDKDRHSKAEREREREIQRIKQRETDRQWNWPWWKGVRPFPRCCLHVVVNIIWPTRLIKPHLKPTEINQVINQQHNQSMNDLETEYVSDYNLASPLNYDFYPWDFTWSDQQLIIPRALPTWCYNNHYIRWMRWVNMWMNVWIRYI